MSSPFGFVNLILLVWRRSPLISSKPQTYHYVSTCGVHDSYELTTSDIQ